MKLMTTFNSLPLLFIMATGGVALAADATSKSQTILRAGSQPSIKNPADYFTGNVYSTRYSLLMTQRRYRPAASLSNRALGPHGIRIRRAST